MSTTSTTKPSILFAASLLALVPGCPLLDVEVEVENVCLTYEGIEVPGVTTGTHVDQEFTYDDLSEIHELLELDGNLELVSAEVRATSGVSDLSFVDSAHLTIASGDASSSLPALDAYTCDGDCSISGATVALLSSGNKENVLEYLRGSSLRVGVKLSGELPTSAWTMDVRVCVRGKLATQVAL